MPRYCTSAVYSAHALQALRQPDRLCNMSADRVRPSGIVCVRVARAFFHDTAGATTAKPCRSAPSSAILLLIIQQFGYLATVFGHLPHLESYLFPAILEGFLRRNAAHYASSCSTSRVAEVLSLLGDAGLFSDCVQVYSTVQLHWAIEILH